MYKINRLNNDWIVGFVDGDGCFNISQTDKEVRYAFVVSQDKDSVSVLYALKNKFGCGEVYKTSGNMMEYRVTAKEHLINIILPFFVQNPLQTIKINDFQKVYNALTGNTYNIPTERPLSNDWVIGFIDAEGSFTIYQVKSQNYKLQLKFTLGQHTRDKYILDRIVEFLGFGSVTLRKPKKGQPYYALQTSSLTNNMTLIKLCTTNTNRCLLKTIKRVSFIRFKKCAIMANEGKHLTPKGVEFIRKLIEDKDKRKEERRNQRKLSQQSISQEESYDSESEEQD